MTSTNEDISERRNDESGELAVGVSIGFGLGPVRVSKSLTGGRRGPGMLETAARQQEAAARETARVQRERDKWLARHPGIPFPDSLLTATERKDRDRAVRLNSTTGPELKQQLVVKWLIAAGGALFFLIASGGAAFVASIAIVAVMVWHHMNERVLWDELHRERPWLASAAIDPVEAERIVAEWQPPHIAAADAPTVVLPLASEGRHRV